MELFKDSTVFAVVVGLMIGTLASIMASIDFKFIKEESGFSFQIRFFKSPKKE
jgi:hypothetical protein